MKTYTIEQICRDLVGPIRPVGKTEIDDARYVNLREHLQIVDVLLASVMDLVPYAKCPEYSKRRAGKDAREYLNEIYNLLGEVLQK